MMNRRHFLELEKQYGPHTCDCCCDVKGLNSQVPHSFLSPRDSFLDTDLQTGNLWVNPPFNKITQFLRHYLHAKLRHPHLRATIVVPDWSSATWRPLLKNFSVVRKFEEGTQLFTKPGSEPGTRTTVGPIPWPVLILRDKDESVEYLPSVMTPLKKKPTVQVELIVSQKGKVLSRIRRGKIVVPTLSGRLGKHTTVKLVEKLLRRHKISKEKGELTLIADNPGSGKTVSTYYFAAPPVSLCKGRFQ